MNRSREVHLFALAVSLLFLNGFGQSDSSSGANIRASVAVFPCRAGAGVTVTEVSFVTERTTLEILRQDQLSVIDKYEISKRTGGTSADALDTIADVNTCFDLGKKCGADEVLRGTLTRRGAALQLDLCMGSVSDRKWHDSIMTSIAGSTLELSEQLPSLLSALFHVAVTAAAPSSTAGTPRIVYTPIRPIRLTVASVPDSGRLYINGVEAGITPFTKDSLKAGTYTCRIERQGYFPFSGEIVVRQNDDKKVMIYLEKAMGSLAVNSTPAATAVTLSNGITGQTPFLCDTLRPGTYTIRLTMDGYVPYQKKVPIVRKRSDTVTAVLMTLRCRDSLKHIAWLKNRLIRRIGFGALTAGFLGTGIYFNIKAQQAIDRETSAYNDYQQLNSSNTPAEFTAAYDKVQAGRRDADSYSGKRNVFYILSAISAPGLGISIRF
jgi:hypothetical protein